MGKKMNFFNKWFKRKKAGTFRSGWVDTGVMEGFRVTNDAIAFSSTEKGQEEDTRIVKKPIEIKEEIISEIPQINLVDIDGQIKGIKRRIKLLKELEDISGKEEEEALQYLIARKKFLKDRDSFGWKVASYSKIDSLCKKYKVRKVSFENYYKSVPTEALEELKKFICAFDKVTDTDARVELIIDDGGKETVKDPILLAHSPFGRWWYVLGAWDKEIEILDELLSEKD